MDFFKNIFCRRNNIAFLVDGPNTIRKDFNLDLNEIKKELQKYGFIKITKIYLDQYASDKLIEAMANHGFKPEITIGDVDVTMAIEAMEYILRKDIDTIALMTRDTDFLPVLRKAKEYGKKTIIVAPNKAFSSALKNTADLVIVVNQKRSFEKIKNSKDLKR